MTRCWSRVASKTSKNRRRLFAFRTTDDRGKKEEERRRSLKNGEIFFCRALFELFLLFILGLIYRKVRLIFGVYLSILFKNSTNDNF